VIIQENCIELIIKRKDLRKLLENGGKVLPASLSDKRTPVDVSNLISLVIEAKQKRFGGEVHLVVPPNSSVSVGHPKTSLMKAIARAHSWYEKVVLGEALDMRSLARQADSRNAMLGRCSDARSSRRTSSNRSWQDDSPMI
jgi:hypothetical protein